MLQHPLAVTRWEHLEQILQLKNFTPQLKNEHDMALRGTQCI